MPRAAAKKRLRGIDHILGDLDDVGRSDPFSLDNLGTTPTTANDPSSSSSSSDDDDDDFSLLPARGKVKRVHKNSVATDRAANGSSKKPPSESTSHRGENSSRNFEEMYRPNPIVIGGDDDDEDRKRKKGEEEGEEEETRLPLKVRGGGGKPPLAPSSSNPSSPNSLRRTRSGGAGAGFAMQRTASGLSPMSSQNDSFALDSEDGLTSQLALQRQQQEDAVDLLTFHASLVGKSTPSAVVGPLAELLKVLADPSQSASGSATSLLVSLKKLNAISPFVAHLGTFAVRDVPESVRPVAFAAFAVVGRLLVDSLPPAALMGSDKFVKLLLAVSGEMANADRPASSSQSQDADGSASPVRTSTSALASSWLSKAQSMMDAVDGEGGKNASAKKAARPSLVSNAAVKALRTALKNLVECHGEVNTAIRTFLDQCGTALDDDAAAQEQSDLLCLARALATSALVHLALSQNRANMNGAAVSTSFSSSPPVVLTRCGFIEVLHQEMCSSASGALYRALESPLERKPENLTEHEVDHCAKLLQLLELATCSHDMARAATKKQVEKLADINLSCVKAVVALSSSNSNNRLRLPLLNCLMNLSNAFPSSVPHEGKGLELTALCFEKIIIMPSSADGGAATTTDVQTVGACVATTMLRKGGLKSTNKKRRTQNTEDDDDFLLKDERSQFSLASSNERHYSSEEDDDEAEGKRKDDASHVHEVLRKQLLQRPGFVPGLVKLLFELREDSDPSQEDSFTQKQVLASYLALLLVALTLGDAEARVSIVTEVSKERIRRESSNTTSPKKGTQTPERRKKTIVSEEKDDETPIAARRALMADDSDEVAKRPMLLLVAILQEFIMFQSSAGILTKSSLVSLHSIIQRAIEENGIEVSAE